MTPSADYLRLIPRLLGLSSVGDATFLRFTVFPLNSEETVVDVSDKRAPM